MDSTLKRLVFAAVHAILAMSMLFPTPMAAARQVHDLVGINVISGDEIAAIDVRVPTSVTLPKEHFDNPNFNVSGGGRVVGFVLVQEGVKPHKAYQLVGLRWGHCSRPGCTPQNTMRILFGMNWKGRHGYRVPAGHYRLYLIADRSLVTVRLELDGLTGQSAFHPAEHVTARIQGPSDITGIHPSLYFASAPQVTMPVPGLMVEGEFEAHGAGAGTSGSCYWRETEDPDDAPPHEDVPGPACYTFASRWGAGSGFSLLPFRSEWLVVAAGNVPSGTWNSRYWSTWAGQSMESDFLNLWLSYD